MIDARSLSVVAIMVLAVPARAQTAAADTRAASLAAFDQVARVLTSPRCQNCHTLTAFPRQGDDRHAHRMNVARGPDGHGASGLHCATCHGHANNPASGVPGADGDWHLAPLSMGWDSLSHARICQHLKDKTRNGGRSGTAIIEHLRTPLVEWAWDPGIDSHSTARTVPPLPYAEFLRAAETWVATGAACPDEAR
jgi:hypothetical protein